MVGGKAALGELTLLPNAFRCLIIAAEDFLVPVTEDLLHDLPVGVFDVASDVIQTRSVIALEWTRSMFDDVS